MVIVGCRQTQLGTKIFLKSELAIIQATKIDAASTVHSRPSRYD
jgi:hypothetical protein